MLLAARHWYDLRWVEWAGLAGVLLTLLGLVVTWWQARKATNAAEAAHSAITRAQRQLRANQLLVLVPQLRWIATEIDAAIEMNNRALTRRHLENWRWQAGNVHGMLTLAASDERDLLRRIQGAVSLAAAAGGALLGNASRPVLDDCSKARDAISAVTDQLNIWVGKNSTNVTGMEQGPS